MLTCCFGEKWERIHGINEYEFFKCLWKKKLGRCEKMSKEGKYERLPLAWGRRKDLEKQFGFAVRRHNFPAGAESLF